MDNLTSYVIIIADAYPLFCESLAIITGLAFITKHH